jgi:hypothetical protein
MTPRAQALAFRIWQYAEPKGWDVSESDISGALGEPAARIRAVIGHKGWGERLRKGVAYASAPTHLASWGQEVVAQYARIAEEPSE